MSEDIDWGDPAEEEVVGVEEILAAPESAFPITLPDRSEIVPTDDDEYIPKIIPEDWQAKLRALKARSSAAYEIAMNMIPCIMIETKIARTCDMKKATVTAYMYGIGIDKLPEGRTHPSKSREIREFFDGTDGWVEFCNREIMRQASSLVARQVVSEIAVLTVRSLRDILRHDLRKKGELIDKRDKRLTLEIAKALGVLSVGNGDGKLAPAGSVVNVDARHVNVFPEVKPTPMLADLQGTVTVSTVEEPH